MFPFNYLIYSWNDWADMGIDSLNPRKNTYLFGAVSNHTLKKEIVWLNVIIQIPFLVFFAFHMGYYMVWWCVTLLFLNFIYNDKKIRMSSRPPFEAFISLGYLLAFTLSVHLNGEPSVPLSTYIYLALFALQSHLIGEIMDIEPDRAGGRKTTATLLGFRWSKVLLAVNISVEAYILLEIANEWLLGGFLVLYAAYMLIDAFFIFKNKPYPLGLMKLFGVCANIAAVVTMVWLWITGGLM
jgi:4-hydroxybenzoate polyprenyltransferase